MNRPLYVQSRACIPAWPPGRNSGSRILQVVMMGLLCGGGVWLPKSAASEMTLYASVCREARQVSSGSLAMPMPSAQWQATVGQRRKLWHEMLGLSPLPERTPLEATVTGVLQRGDYVVEKVHFQSLPGAYVIGNVYRPAKMNGRLPAVLYLCGHTKGKANPPYQANPRWFGQHGYVALVLDPIQLGESQGMHHGTAREERWDWPSRGYTPAGTEVWNAMRALDYLQSRADVDGERMGVTGLSGGGVISWCLGAADERVKVVVPVCQSGSIEHVVVDRATDGHCDCAFWINYYRWCWPDVGALIAPRAFLVAAGSEDVLWRPYGYRDVAHRIRHQYAALDVPERFDLVEDLSPHGYTRKLRQAIFTWFNQHLKGDPTPVTDDVTDFVEPEENLLVFGGKLPKADQMRRVDTLLVSRAELPTVTNQADWRAHQETTLSRLRELTFRYVPATLDPVAYDCRADGRERDGSSFATYAFDTRDGLTLRVKTARLPEAAWPVPTVAFAVPADARSTFAGGGSSRPSIPKEYATAGVEVRNTAATSIGPGYLWTLRRVYPLLGQTLPERQVYDLLAGIALMRQEAVTGPVAIFGQGNTAPLAIYAAILDPQVAEVILAGPPESHTSPHTPEFLGILRIGDLPQNLALVYPRPITFIGGVPPAYEWTRRAYQKLGAGDRIRVIPDARRWRPWPGRILVEDPRKGKNESPATSEVDVNREEKGLVFAAIMPHGPDIVPEVTKDPTLMAETRRAMEETARRFAAARVETLVLLDPELIHTRQGEALTGSRSFFKGDSVLSIGTAAYAGGRLGLTEERFECDTKLAQAIFEAGGHGEFPVAKDAGDKDKGELLLRGGSLIPLWYSIRPLPRPRPKLVVISPSTMVPREKLMAFGQLIAKIAKESGKRVALIASADQGHRHDQNHPRFGFSPLAAQHDVLYCEAVSSHHLEKLLEISNEVLEESFTDSFWQTLILAGGLKAAPMDLTFFNYARPSYYGMVVAAFQPHSAGKAPELSKP